MRISDWSSDVCSSDLEFLNGGTRYILAAQSAQPARIRACDPAADRIGKVRAWRLGQIAGKESKDGSDRAGASARALADIPTEYHVTVIPNQPYMVVPENGSNKSRICSCWMAQATGKIGRASCRERVCQNG